MKHFPVLLSIVTLAGCTADTRNDDEQPVTDDDAARPVVQAEQPLSLDNPNADPVVWPIWGSSFTLAEAVTVRVALEAEGASGLVLAGPGEAEERAAIELVRTADAWSLRETEGGAVVKEAALAGAGSDQFVIELASGNITVTNAKGESATLSRGLAGDGEAAGVYVNIAPGGKLAVSALEVSQALPRAKDLGTPLRELGQARGIEIGTATDIWPPLHDLAFESLLGEQFSAAAPTEFYWPTTRGEDEDYYFVPADLMVNYASVHGQRVSGYFLVWDFEPPEWVNTLAESGDAEALGAVFDDHITTLVSRYRGRVQEWIVVNEAIWGPEVTGEESAMYAETIWSNTLGEGYIERAFRTARAADPDAVLLYNETGAEALGPKSDFVYQMASELVANGVPIDGVGLQFHIDAASPPDMADVRANFERIGALGLGVYITELDVNLVSVTGTDEDKLALQSKIYVDVLEACLSVPECKSYTIFGISDKFAWDEQEGGSAAPLLWDESYRPKPAFYAIQAALENKE